MKTKANSIHRAIAANQQVKEKNYWLEQLSGEPSLEGFPAQRGGSVSRNQMNAALHFPSVSLQIEGHTADRLITLANRSDARLHVILLTSLYVLLFKYTGNEDIVLGSPIYRQEGVEGDFINTMLPLRTQVSSEMSFKELLLQVRQTAADAVEHQNFPIDLLFDQLREEGKTADVSLYSTVVMLDNIHDMRYLDEVPYKMLFHFIREDTTIRGTVYFDPDSYTESAVTRITHHFTHLLGQALVQVGATIRELDMLPEHERTQILLEFNGKQGDFPTDATVSQLIEEQVLKTPDAVAVQCGEHRMTYRELNEQANRLAWLLKEKGMGPDQLAAVLCERSIQMLVGILGVFKAGGAYVPIDAAYPMERIRTMLADSKASVVLTNSDVWTSSQEKYRGLVAGTSVEHIVYLDRLEDPEAEQDQFRTERAVSLLEQGESLVPGPEMKLCSGGSMLTHEAYQERTGQLAGFLKERLDTQSDRVGVLLDDTLDKLVACSSLQRLGLDWTVLEAKHLGEQLQESSITFLLTTSRYVDEVDRLVWESECLHGYVLLDEYDAVKSEKQLQMSNIWEAVAEETSEALNDYGWSSSFGGKAFSLEEMQEYIDNFQTKLKPYLTKESKVLEVGCGHGLLLFHLAPEVGEYVATDLSGTIIERNRERARREGLSHVTLKQAAASEIGGIGESDFDVIVMSSVVHYFPNTLYLEEVIRSAIGLLKEEGILYLDDLLDHRKKRELVESTAAYKQANPGVPVKTSWDEDLFVAESFFEDLQQKYPEICGWESSRKLGVIENELTRFRYDVMLKVNKKQAYTKHEEKQEARDSSLNSFPASLQKGRYTWEHVQGTVYKDLDLPLESQGMEKLGTVTDQSAIACKPADNPPCVNQAGDLCYVIYTSGSTGRPKGAMVEHRGMLNHLYAKIHDFQITKESVVAQNSSHCFDISVWQFFASLVTGGQVVIYPNELTLDAESFITHIQQDGVTILEVVPSYLSVLLEQLEPEQMHLEKMKLMVVTGEALKPNLVSSWFGKYPGIRMANAYGPTEASDDITHYLMDQDPGRVLLPVGSPVQNMNIYIVDETGELCPIGVKGEIWVAGVGVGRGYLNQEEKTKEAFTEDPFAKESGVRLYKTGDIGRWLEDGNIEFLGRKDDQVKIRGYRIEIGEVESRLSKVEGIKEAVVTVRGEEESGKYLCAYVTGEEKIEAEKVKEQLSRSLPEYMIPEYVVEMEKLPLTRNGKVDRKALPAPEKQEEGNTRYEAPANEIEEKLVEIWSEVLGIERIGVQDNFFERGGHSLKVTRLVAQIHKQTNVRLSYKDVFERPTIRLLAECMGKAEQQKFQVIEPAPKAAFYPLSSEQKRMFIQQQIYPESTSYNISLVYRVEGLLNKEKMTDAFNKLIQRHESLRTCFTLVDDNPVQKVLDHAEVEFIETACQEEQIEEAIHGFIRPFHLEQAPLFRVGLIKQNRKHHILMIDMHHIISDGMSVDLIAADFFDLYAGMELPALPIQYKDYVVWQNETERQQEIQKQEDYWMKVFAKEVIPLELPNDFKRSTGVLESEASIASFAIDKSLTENVRDFAVRKNSSLFVVLLAVYNVVLSKCSGQEDIVVGTATSGRNHEDLTRVVGMFVKTVPLRNFPNEDKTFSVFLEEVHQNALLSFQNQDYPFDMLVSKLNLNRDVNRNPLFDTFFQIQYFEQRKKEVGDLVFHPYTYTRNNTSQFELELSVEEEQEQVHFHFYYSTNLYKNETIHKLWNDYLQVLRTILQDEQVKLGDIRLEMENKKKAEIRKLHDSIQFNF